MQVQTAEETSKLASKGSVKFCKVAGCRVDLASVGRMYCFKKGICPEHMKAEAVSCEGCPEQYRFCQQCGRLQPLHCFEGKKRSCKASLIKRKANHHHHHDDDTASAEGQQQRKSNKQEQNQQQESMVADISAVSDESGWTADETTYGFGVAANMYAAAAAAPSSYSLPLATIICPVNNHQEAAAATLADAWCNAQQQQQQQWQPIMAQQQQLLQKQESSCWTGALAPSASALAAPAPAAAPQPALAGGILSAASQASAAIDQLMEEILIDQELSSIMAAASGDDQAQGNRPIMTSSSHGSYGCNACAVPGNNIAHLEQMIEQELLAAAAEVQGAAASAVAVPAAAAAFAARPVSAGVQLPQHVMVQRAPTPMQQQLAPAFVSAYDAAGTGPWLPPALCVPGSHGMVLSGSAAAQVAAPAALPAAPAVQAAVITSLGHKAKLQALQLQSLQLQNVLQQVQELRGMASQLRGQLAPLTPQGWSA